MNEQPPNQWPITASTLCDITNEPTPKTFSINKRKADDDMDINQTSINLSEDDDDSCEEIVEIVNDLIDKWMNDNLEAQLTARGFTKFNKLKSIEPKQVTHFTYREAQNIFPTKKFEPAVQKTEFI